MNWIWFYKFGLFKWFYEISGCWLFWFVVVVVLLIVIGCVWGLVFVLLDYQQGNSFCIIYIYVLVVFFVQFCYVMLVVVGVVGLIWKMKIVDVVVQCVVFIGVWMIFVVLFIGVVWGKLIWGVWWVWDVCLMVMLILFFFYFGIIVFGQVISNCDSVVKVCVVLVIVGVVNILIIKYLVEWWNILYQLVIFIIIEKLVMLVEMWLLLLIMVFGFYCFFVVMLLVCMCLEVFKCEFCIVWVKVEVKVLVEKV